jgi:hypothetical protein
VICNDDVIISGLRRRGDDTAPHQLWSGGKQVQAMPRDLPHNLKITVMSNPDHLKDVLTRAREEVAKVIIGQSDVIDKTLIAIFTGQHALIEGVPGVAKTLLVRTLAHVLGCEFARIQFTPDLMPADITGTNVFNLQRNEFTLIKGPIFTSFLLADEINRARPRLSPRSCKRCRNAA